jgi:hypothetical protein
MVLTPDTEGINLGIIKCIAQKRREKPVADGAVLAWLGGEKSGWFSVC